MRSNVLYHTKLGDFNAAELESGLSSTEESGLQQTDMRQINDKINKAYANRVTVLSGLLVWFIDVTHYINCFSWDI